MIRIGTWNVRTMLRPGKMSEIVNELKNYKVDIAAIQEIRWKGAGEIVQDGFAFVYSGDNIQGRNGTGFFVMERLRKSILHFKPMGGRLSYLRIKTKPNNLSIVNAYAPTEESNEEEKDRFYEELESLCETIPKHDTMVLLGDFNAKIGKEDHVRAVAGKQTIHTRTNDNGTRLCDLAAALDMIVSSTKFKHKNAHKITWTWPGGSNMEGNQIDHILVKRRRASSIKDVRSFRGANADSDHYLVIAEVKQKTSVAKTKHELKKRIAIERLKHETILNNYEDKLKDEMEKRKKGGIIDLDEEWNIIAESVTTTVSQVVGYKDRPKRKAWFDNECMEKNGEKKTARLRWLETSAEIDLNNYKRKRKEADKLYKLKKNKWLDDRMKEIEESSSKHDMKAFYNQIKNKRKTHTIKIRGMKNNDGELKSEPQEIKKIWRKHFEGLLNVHIEEEIDQTEIEDVDNEDDMTEPDMEEILEVINGLKNGKAAGSDGIMAEMVKCGGEALHTKIYELIKRIWRQERMPKGWYEGIIVTIRKKGDAEKCENYRGITLLNVAYKILSTVIHNRLREYTEKIIGNYQFGFRRGRSTIGAIHCLKQIGERSYDYDMDLHLLFVDFKQAFDTLNRRKLNKIMKELGIPNKLRRLVMMTLNKTTAKIRTPDGETESLVVNTGVRQGDAISATLFNLVLEYIVRKSKCNGTIINKESQLIAYADDVVIIARTIIGVKKILREIIKAAEELGLKVNVSKTKYMKYQRAGTDNATEIEIDDCIFQKVESFNYLGVRLASNNDGTEEVKARVQAGYRAYFTNKDILRDRQIRKETKIKIYRTLIRTVVTYAAETMCFTRREEEQFRVFERKIMRVILGPKRINGEIRARTNSEILRELDGEDVVKFMKAQRISWLGHIMRSSDGDVTQRLTMWKPDVVRTRGRPKARWWKGVTEDLKEMKVVNWRQICRDRKMWRLVVKEARTHSKL